MERYYSYRSYLEKTYGSPVYRVGVDAGFTCPNRDSMRQGGCIYCDVHGGTAAYQRKQEAGFAELVPGELALPAADVPDRNMDLRLASISSQIESGIEFLKRRYQVEDVSLYLQAFSNTFAPVDQLKKIYDHALSRHRFTEFIVSTRPDCTGEQVCSLLSEYRSKVSDVWVELGLQTANEKTLEFLKRGHTVGQVRDVCRRLRKHGIKISLHVILGLPGEGNREFDGTAKFIREVHPEAVKIHNLHIPAGTLLLDMYRSGEVRTVSVQRHISQVGYLLQQLPGDIVVQRVVCDTPTHRLCAPRNFPKKGQVIQMLKKHFEEEDIWQGKELGFAIADIGKFVG